MTDESSFFLDSNVWLYALSNEDAEKAETASALVKNLGERIRFTTQVVNEVCVNLKRKSSLEEGEIRRLIDSFYLNYTVVEIKESVLISASELREHHSFSFWDSLIAASALSANAEILYSEDMQDGFVLDNKLKIINPFKI